MQDDNGRTVSLKDPAGTASAGISFLIIALFWTAVIATLAGWHYYRTAEAALENARTAARHSFGKDVTFRRWATGHGGVYVPVTEATPPNPYLTHVFERDISSPSGRALTLINPAYMLRQMHEMADELFGVRGHITSLKPLRPENAPDEWEIKALHAFQTGTEEWSSKTSMDDEPYLRLMRPLIAEEGCLKCHGVQGYVVGDILGGVSVAIPWEPYRQALHAALPGFVFGYGGLWLFGLLFIVASRRRLREHVDKVQESEARLRHWHDLMQYIIEHDPNAIFVLDRDLRHLFVSDRFLRDFGLGGKDIIGKHHYEVFPDIPQKWREVHQRALKGEILSAEDERYVREDGRIDYTRWQCRPWHEVDGSIGGIILYTEVVTERVEASRALQQRTQELEERSAELERFNYTVSHDLKSPLVTVKSFLGFLEKDLAAGDAERIQTDIDYMRAATQKMSQLLDELLEMSRIGRIVNPPVRVAYGDLIQEVLALVAGPIAERGVEIQVSDEDLVLFGDRSRLVEIWQNLLENAVKYMGGQTAPFIYLGVEDRAGEQVFFVRDNGMGIDPRYAEKIFGLFEKLDRQTEGSGLGLALVKRIVEVYGGRIWVESVGEGQGSCFFFTLPGACTSKGEEIS
ncbi:ATP-binding protein [Geoalkalibacter halelectricus]|uniref:ATP-binding protein n=1 Tax=Geoalkalibacter halelectricus TaxID=2847045 RepID=UPI003D24601C